MGDQKDAAVPETQNVLPQHAVEQEAVLLPAHPDLPAVVVVAIVFRRLDMGFGGLLQKMPGNQLPAVPLAVVHYQLAQLGQILRPHIQAPTALFHALGTGFPVKIGDSHGGKQTRGQKFRQGLTGEPVNQDRQNVGVEAVVLEFAGGIGQTGGEEEAPHPAGLGHGAGLVELIAGAHGQQALHGQILHKPLAQRAAFLGKQIHQPVLRRQESVVHQKAYGEGGDAFAGGEGHFGQLRILCAKGGAAQQPAVSHHQNAVHPQGRILLQGIEEPGDVPGRDALPFRGFPGQGLGGAAQGNGRLLGAEINERLRGIFGVQQPHNQLQGAVGRG